MSDEDINEYVRQLEEQVRRLEDDLAVQRRVNRAERRLSRAVMEAQPFLSYAATPTPRMVAFVGGPLHLTQRVLEQGIITDGRYEVAVVAPVEAHESGESGMGIGVYRIVQLPGGPWPEPYTVGLWQGVTTALERTTDE